MKKIYAWGVYGIDNFLWDVRKALWKKYSVNDSARILEPLVWYCKTGRASVGFCKALVECKPYVIARVLERHDMEAYDDVLDAVRKKIVDNGTYIGVDYQI